MKSNISFTIPLISSDLIMHIGCVFSPSEKHSDMFLYFSFPSLLYMSGRCGKSLSLRASCPDACKHNSLWWTMCLENSRREQTKALFHSRLSLTLSLSALLTCCWGFIPCLFAQSACGGAYATDFQEIAHCLLLTAVWILFRAASFLTIGVKIARWLCPKAEKKCA